MQTFADQLRRGAKNLKPAKTDVLLENGLTVQEERDGSGEFAVIFETEDDLVDLKVGGDSVNVATAVKNFFPKHFEYLELKALDCPSQDLSHYFEEATLFMKKAVEKGGKCLVHCNAGISRSSTLCIVYIMVLENKKLSEALDQVKSVRPVARPNEGFMRQLEQFDKQLCTFGKDTFLSKITSMDRFSD